MSCDQKKDYLKQQLSDLEKNRGFISKTFETMVSNPLITYLGQLLGTSPKDINGKDLINKIVEQTNNAVAPIQYFLAGFFSIPKNLSSFYLYYLLLNQLKPLLERRLILTRQILDYLYKINNILSENYFFRISPSSDKELRTLLTLLIDAQRALSQIEYRKVTKRDETGKVIEEGYSIPSYITMDSGAGGPIDVLNSTKIYGTPLFLFIKQAFSSLEQAQNFLRNIITTKTMSIQEKKILAKLEEFYKTNNHIIGHLASLIPISLFNLLEKIDTQHTIKSKFGNIGKEALGITSKENLSKLNGQIGLIKLISSNFETMTSLFKKNIQQSVGSELIRYHNIELDKLIIDLQTTERPYTLIDFFTKAPAWYSRIEIIKYSLYLIDLNLIDINIVPVVPDLNEWSVGLQSMEKTDYGLLLEQKLTKFFPQLIKILYLGNFLNQSIKNVSVLELIKLCEQSISQDISWLGLLDSAPRPPGYDLFEQSLNAGINKLQTSGILGTVAPVVASLLRTGSFLAIPATLNLNNVEVQLNILNSVENLGKIIEGAEGLLSSVFSLEESFHNFEDCEKLQNKNLFISPFKDNPDPQTIVDSITDAYSELWEAVSLNL